MVQNYLKKGANGNIWVLKVNTEKPTNAKQLYQRLQIKKISQRDWVPQNGLGVLQVSRDGIIDLNHDGWNYLQSARCTSRVYTLMEHIIAIRGVTGSVEHNMERMMINSYAFEQ